MLHFKRPGKQAISSSGLEFYLVTGFFLGLLITGLLIFSDYGISSDEPVDYATGLVNGKYILSKIAPNLINNLGFLKDVPALETWQDRQYGAFFQMPASMLPNVLGFTELRDIYLFRHLLNFLFYYSATICFYSILKSRFENWAIALAGVAAFVLSPRIFADAFYNSKDIIFLCLIVFGWWSLFKLRSNLSFKWLVLHAFICAAAINVRIMGMMLPGLTFMWLLYDIVFSRSIQKKNKSLKLGIAYGIFYLAFIVLVWPFLWSSPLTNITEVFGWLKRNGDIGFNVLYWGEGIPFTQLPWHYIPVYVLITTPVLYLLFFIAGLFYFFRSTLRYRLAFFHSEKGKLDVSAVLLFILPVLMVIITKAIVYDGWRHLFFIYPAVIYIATLAVYNIWEYTREKSGRTKLYFNLFVGGGLIYFGYIAVLMIRMHPYQNVYFNVLPPKFTQQNFDMDYWGLSYREGFEFLLKNDPNPEIKIFTNQGWLGVNNNVLFSPEEKKRLVFVPLSEAQYFVTEHRFHPHPYSWEEMATDNFKEIHHIRVDGLKILTIYKLK